MSGLLGLSESTAPMDGIEYARTENPATKRPETPQPLPTTTVTGLTREANSIVANILEDAELAEDDGLVWSR